MTTPTTPFQPLTLNNGATLPNRIVKAAMEESLGTADHVPGDNIFRLYDTWAAGGAGTLITGNVMINAHALTGPRGMILDNHQPIGPYATWAATAHAHGAKILMQINHPGRQVPANQPGIAVGPSDIPVNIATTAVTFARPTPMSEDDITATIADFITTATLAEKAGFDGVEVHAAHGYLLSQFLSPLVNNRTDAWGGSLENRARFLIDIVRGIREKVADDFIIAVKLNSADFQRGGFELDDARAVIAMLAPAGADVVELSGGSYESPAMTGNAADNKTRAREAYFLDMAQALVEDSPLPLMVTGGITTHTTAEKVLASGVDLIGMGTALAAQPDLPRAWEAGEKQATPTIPETKIRNKAIASAASMAWVRYQMARLAHGKTPRTSIDPRLILGAETLSTRRDNAHLATWLNERAAAQPKKTPGHMKKVLFVVTGATTWTLKDGQKHPTGYWAEELATPHKLFTEAGWDITIATPGGVTPTLDELSLGIAGGLPAHRKRTRAYLDSISAQLNNPIPLNTVTHDDYDIIFYPGGHGPMEDLATDETSGQLLVERLHSGKPLALLCHAPAAILAATLPHGSNAFAGRKMTGLSNKEELLNPFAWKAEWFLEDRMKQVGVSYSAGFPLRPHIVVDGNLYSGQNPQSSEKLARRLIADHG